MLQKLRNLVSCTLSLESKAVNEVGLFGNQNTVYQPTTPKWRHTVEWIKTHFTKWDV